MTDSAHRPTCPRCSVGTDPTATGCPRCGLAWVVEGGLLDTLAATTREARAAEVEGFYTKNPFPGYAPADDGGSLLDRSRRAPFLTQLDRAIAPDARVLDAGCGTAQLAAFLALAGPRRRVFAMDGCRESLRHAEQFRARTALTNLQLVRADLFDLPVPEDGFDVVICRGVVHHTPDPDGAIRAVAKAVRPGGLFVIGFYETRARLFHRARRGLATVLRRPVRLLDPILRRGDLDEEKKRIWIEDQYRHPLEHILPLPRVVMVLDELGFGWVRTVPPLGAAGSLFEPEVRPGSLRRRRLGWALRGVTDPDAGLVGYVARAPGRAD